MEMLRKGGKHHHRSKDTHLKHNTCFDSKTKILLKLLRIKNNSNSIQIYLSIFEWTGLQILPDNSCSIMCYFYYTQDLAAAENVCLGQSSKNLLTLQDAQAKLQYGELLKILHFACNYSLITEGAELSLRFGNRLKPSASSIK